MREIPISDQIYDLLLKFKTTENVYIFKKNKPLDPRTYQYKFKYFLRNAGVEKHNFHTLRHTFTTRMCEAGVNIKVIQDALGHSDISTTLNIYADVTKELKKDEFTGLDAYFKKGSQE